MYYCTHFNSPLGDILIAGNETGITGLWIEGQKYTEKTMPEGMAENDNIPILCEGVRWLSAYFAKKNPPISGLALSPKGSEFRKTVWKILTEIPYGEVVSYGDVAKECAKRMGKDKMSAQAVGGAVGHNPISIIIPCHRVVGSNGSLTGYAGGLDKKLFLLRHEGADISRLFMPKQQS